ncbi:class E sortase [Methanobacterium sp. ACI-7]|uniref:class E sortase n=1 Tax=unclassified Methanobacterium TaxID=2627676 RepID=UPI0039C0DF8E
MIIISLYFLVEVSYYAAADTNIQNNPIDTPYLKISSIGIDQSINNKSIDYGIYHEPKSANPGVGTVALFGHRTFYGSPFLNLDKLKQGDNIIISWPGIGNVEYKVVKSYIVPASYRLPVDQGKTLFLITCYPLGSTKERLIIQANQTNIYPFDYSNTKTPQTNQIPYSILFISAFLGIGLLLTYFYPVDSDKIFLLIATVALTLFLIYAYVFPIPPNGITSQLSNINGWFGI